MTSSLFTATLMASFLVVGVPHILPCPVDTRAYADAEDPSRRRRRKRKCLENDGKDTVQQSLPVAQGCNSDTVDGMEGASRKRECPVPKPGGLIGQIMGWQSQERRAPPEVRVEPVKRRPRDGGED